MTRTTIDVVYRAEETAKRFHRDPSYFRGIRGPVGSGKTVACIEETKRLAFSQLPNARGIRRTKPAIIRNTYGELKSTTIATWLEWFPAEVCPIVFDAPITGKFHNLLPDGTSIEMTALFIAMDLPAHSRKVRSLEISSLFLNEARYLSKDVVDAGIERVGRFPPKNDYGLERVIKFEQYGKIWSVTMQRLIYGSREGEYIEVCGGPRECFPSPWHVDVEAKTGYRHENEDEPYPIEVLKDYYQPGRVIRSPGGATRPCVIADTNSPDDSHWWYRFAEGELRDDEKMPKGWKFYSQPPALIKLPNGDYKPNPKAENVRNHSMGYGYYFNLIEGKTQDYIDVMILNKYGAIQDGKPVYGDMFNKDIHVSKNEMEPLPNEPLRLSFDFGRRPTCLVWQKTKKGQVRVLREYRGYDMGIVTFGKTILMPALKEDFPDNGISLRGNIADPTGKDTRGDTETRSALDELKRKFKIRARPARSNLIDKRIGAVENLLNTMISGQPMLLIDPRCRTLIAGLEGKYKFERIQLGGVERYKEIPLKDEYSDPQDCLQYIGLEVYQEDKGQAHPGSDRPRTGHRPASNTGY